MKKEINGKRIRDEFIACYMHILAEQEHFDQLRFNNGGIERRDNVATIQTRIHIKQTELDYMCKHFPQDSIYRWKLSIIHGEGDDAHFGKTYLFDKISKFRDV